MLVNTILNVTNQALHQMCSLALSHLDDGHHYLNALLSLILDSPQSDAVLAVQHQTGKRWNDVADTHLLDAFFNSIRG